MDKYLKNLLILAACFALGAIFFLTPAPQSLVDFTNRKADTYAKTEYDASKKAETALNALLKDEAASAEDVEKAQKDAETALNKVKPAADKAASNAWHLFGIFVGTIVALILKPFPMGTVSMLAIAMCALTKTLTVANSISGFSNTTIWLIVIAFFISRGIIKTGLGERIAYIFVKLFGKSTLGLSYSLIASDLVLSPAMPSNTARAGGVIAPIVQSLSKTFGSNPDDGTARKIGAFLNLASFQGDMITSAMFMTAMAANPMAVDLAKKTLGIELTWASWFVAAIVPGLVALVVIPLLIYLLYKPEITKTEGASELANKKLKEMGPIKKNEWFMIFSFILLLVLWIFGSNFGLDATAAAFVGLGVLLITQVLTWEDVKSEKNAWDTLVWFAALVMLATYMNSLGFIPWFSTAISDAVGGMNWVLGFVILVLVYLYSHYFFASATAHVSAMYVAFVSVLSGTLANGAVTGGIGVPAMLACLALAFFSNLCGGITHYGSGAAPAFFGSGYVSQNRWWGMGFICSIANIIIWLLVGGLWWKILGLW